MRWNSAATMSMRLARSAWSTDAKIAEAVVGAPAPHTGRHAAVSPKAPLGLYSPASLRDNSFSISSGLQLRSKHSRSCHEKLKLLAQVGVYGRLSRARSSLLFLRGKPL